MLWSCPPSSGGAVMEVGASCLPPQQLLCWLRGFVVLGLFSASFFENLFQKKIPFLTCWAPHTSHVVPSPPLLVTDEGENRNDVVTEGSSMCKLLHVQTR